MDGAICSIDSCEFWLDVISDLRLSDYNSHLRFQFFCRPLDDEEYKMMYKLDHFDGGSTEPDELPTEYFEEEEEWDGDNGH